MRSLGNEELGWGLCPQTPGIDRFAARMNGRRHGPPPAIPAAESALGLRPRRALSSAQLFSEWITSTPPCNRIAANGDYPLNCLSHDWGSLQALDSPSTPPTSQAHNRAVTVRERSGTNSHAPAKGPRTEKELTEREFGLHELSLFKPRDLQKCSLRAAGVSLR